MLLKFLLAIYLNLKILSFFPFHFPYFKFFYALFADIKFLYFRQNTERKHFYILLRYDVFVAQYRVNFPPSKLDSAFCLIHAAAAASFVFRFLRFRSVPAQSTQYFPLFDFGTNALPHTAQRFDFCGFIASANSTLSCGGIAALNHLQMTEYEFRCTQSQSRYKHLPSQ